MNTNNYSQYVTTDNSWVDEEAKRLGGMANLNAMMRKIHQHMNKMKPGEYFLVENVQPENVRVFIKAAMEIIEGNPNFYFTDNTYTIFKRM